ncbi:ATP-binding protein [Kitasatospora purpeofusca]|uniref:ATP-binding protein n=1 Tax=Kitasatospora purpeofusca TaxID=67352 RepID=A0ABZ1TXD1_9ACTN|nr:ATP-binding protein [Kitasatospora purpeofusca]
MTISDLESAHREAVSGNLGAFIDLPESSWLDAKSGIYPLNDQRGTGRAELCKDVAAMANAVGGLIIIGLRTEIHGGQELISARAPVPSTVADPKQHRDLVAQDIRPPVRDLEITWVPDTDDRGYLVIYVPRQRAADKPFVVPAHDAKGRAGIAVPIRSADGTDWHDAADLQRLLALGWATAASTALDPSPQERADHAMAQRLLRAIPVDASWIKNLRHGAPFSRVPASTARAVDTAAGVLSDEAVTFLDTETAAIHKEFTAAVIDLSDRFQSLFAPRQGPMTYFEVPPEWKGENPDRYYSRLSELRRSADHLLDTYRRWVNQLNAKGFMNAHV